MSILDSLVTDRTQADVDRLKRLMAIPVQDMTQAQIDEFLYGAQPLLDSNNQQLNDSSEEPLASNEGVIKGAYNYSDLNRVEEAVDYVADALVQADTDLKAYATSLGVAWDTVYDLPYDPADYNLTVKTDWAVGDIPSATQMARYYSNLLLIQAAFLVYTAIPDSMNKLDYVGANNIEQMLLDEYQALQDGIELREAMIRAAAECYKSGEFYSGEVY